MDRLKSTLIILAIAAAVFFVFAAILMPVWNYTIPKLAGSVDSTYDETSFTPITYTISMVFTVLIAMLFSTGSIGAIISQTESKTLATVF